MIKRSEFIKIAGGILIGVTEFIVSDEVQACQNHKTFEDKLRAEVEDVMKKYACEENNDSTHRFIEAEIDDWAHEYVMSGELDVFKVQCGSNETESGEEYWVQCMFKEHDAEKVKVLKCEMTV